MRIDISVDTSAPLDPTARRVLALLLDVEAPEASPTGAKPTTTPKTDEAPPEVKQPAKTQPKAPAKAPAKEAPAKEAPAKEAPAKEAPAKAPAKTKAPAKAKTPAKAATEAAEYTAEDAVSRATFMVTNQLVAQAREALEALGAKRVTDLAEADIPAFMAATDAVLEERGLSEDRA